MIDIVPITEASVAQFKATRLRALLDSPGAFGSTYAWELQLTEAGWMERIGRWSNGRGIGYLAMDDGTPCGIAGCLLDNNLMDGDPTRAQLISMWVAPTHRELGVGRLLVDEVIIWARSRGAHRLQLSATGRNEAAIQFYMRLGFAFTGKIIPYPNDPTEIEREMELMIADPTAT
jgi:ribosomal protein S18 acetylase RimI-like enzyme